MTDYPPAGQKVTRGGQTLTARVWALLEDAYRAAGLDPARYLEVSQGSYKAGGGAAASGSTHDAAGAADLRTRNLPASAQANLCERLVVEIRKRGGCAWYRDQAHGGMSPHVHVIVRDESPLSSGAAQQVRDYDRGYNGLSNKGPDYHPRPAQLAYRYPPTTTPPPPEQGTARGEDDPVLITYQEGQKRTFWLLAGGRLTSITSTDAGTFTGVRITITDKTTWERVTAGYPLNRG